ncbi:MAG: chorismate-binding protein [Leptospirales bacterium]|nr:chorismate-binding protein [Leptospirales bacterium]
MAGAPQGGFWQLSEAQALVQCSDAADVSSALDQLDELVARGLHVAGYLSYEALDGTGIGAASLAEDRPGNDPWRLRFAAFQERRWLSVDQWRRSGLQEGYSLRATEDPERRRRFLEGLQGVRNYLAAGESYQINLTGAIALQFSGSPLALFERLYCLQPTAMAACLLWPDEAILSLSPELFFETFPVADGWQIQSRPMKGTFARDAVGARHGPGDAKSLAENYMIVDVLRNDLGRRARRGSVRVLKPMTLEEHGPLLQSVSTVEALLAASEHRQLFRSLIPALFPCASVSGAPRLAARQRIRLLEDQPRGVYCGAVGLADKDGARFNVAIRTLQIDRNSGRARFGVGAGIVWDSQAEAEWQECELKAAFLRMAEDDFALIETMRLERGRIALLSGHLQRLQDSARLCAMDFPARAIEDALQTMCSRAGSEVWRLRLLLHRAGQFEVQQQALHPAGAAPRPPAPRRLALAAQRIWSADPFRRIKSTRRAEYDAARLLAARHQADDILFLNERGEVVETSIANLLLRSPDGNWLTPAVECGALPGVWLQNFELSLRRRGRTLVRRRLSLDEARRAGDWYVCNALRGRQPALLLDGPAIA